jgi:hypothetical protein
VEKSVSAPLQVRLCPHRLQQIDKNSGISSSSHQAAVAPPAKDRGGKLVSQFTVCLRFALTSSTSNDVIIQTLRSVCLRTVLHLADGSVVNGVLGWKTRNARTPLCDSEFLR